MEKGSGTRSGLLWEVERILSECEEKPNILLMENVPQIHSENAGNDKHFKEWQLRLEELGYKNYWEDMIATDYGIPQTRNRTFMVSILGDYNYKFPKRTKLKLKLKDLLEPNDKVDKKYLLNDKMIRYILNRTPIGEKGNFANNIIGKEAEKSAGTVTTKGCDSPTSVRGGDNIIILNMTQAEINEKIYLKSEKKRCCENCKHFKIFAEYQEGCELLGSELTKFENIDKEIYCCKWYEPIVEINKVEIIGNYSPSGHNAANIVDSNGSSPTIMENHGTVTATVVGGVGEKKSNGGTQWYQQDRIYDDKVAISVTTVCNPYYLNNLIARKLTPREYFRLQGVKDSDYDLIMEHQTNGSGYHLAGDSICINCLLAIFSTLTDINWQDKFNPKEWWKNE